MRGAARRRERHGQLHAVQSDGGGDSAVRLGRHRRSSDPRGHAPRRYGERVQRYDRDQPGEQQRHGSDDERRRPGHAHAGRVADDDQHSHADHVTDDDQHGYIARIAAIDDYRDIRADRDIDIRTNRDLHVDRVADDYRLAQYHAACIAQYHAACIAQYHAACIAQYHAACIAQYHAACIAHSNVYIRPCVRVHYRHAATDDYRDIHPDAHGDGRRHVQPLSTVDTGGDPDAGYARYVDAAPLGCKAAVSGYRDSDIAAHGDAGPGPHRDSS